MAVNVATGVRPTIRQPRKKSLLLLIFLVIAVELILLPSAIFCQATAAAADHVDDAERRYCLIGVSGTLQDGFPLRHHLDYYHPPPNGTAESGSSSSPAVTATAPSTPAQFLGRALVRGVKAYLDVKDAGWREHVPEPLPPRLPNAVVLATGCWEHANLYHIYAVDERQVWNILAGEPRFLAIAPDAGLVDLAAPETDAAPLLRALAAALAAKQPPLLVAVPLVTGVWFHPGFVESPAAYTLEDGTRVTSFETGLAAWAGVSANDLVKRSTRDAAYDSASSLSCSAADATAEALKRVSAAVRRAETSAAEGKVLPPPHPASLKCRSRARLGVGPEHPRLNAPIPASTLFHALREHPPAFG